jgi:hypothetical protein
MMGKLVVMISHVMEFMDYEKLKTNLQNSVDKLISNSISREDNLKWLSELLNWNNVNEIKHCEKESFSVFFEEILPIIKYLLNPLVKFFLFFLFFFFFFC